MTEHPPMTAADREMADELAVQLKTLLAGRTVATCVAILAVINAGLDRDHDPPAEPMVN